MAEETNIRMTRPASFLVPISNISSLDKERRIVAGYASFDVIDRQGERITTDAMRTAMEKFMQDPEFANTHVMHGNVAVGKVIQSYTDKNGVVWETKVDDTGTFIVSEIRHGLVRADQTWELIEEGKLKSYSVGGLSIAPKELVCANTGVCYYQINELEIHEFSYVDRPAVKGADFVIVKRGDDLTMEVSNIDQRPKAMACPLKKPDSCEQIYKLESPKSDVIIMTDTQAEVSEVTDEIEKDEAPAIEEVAEVSVEETEKAEATPDLLEIKAQNEKILNLLENFLRPPEEPTKMDFDYPEDHMKFLKDRYGEENAFHLFTILGDDYSRLLDKADPEPEPAPVAEPEPEPVTVEAETVDAEIVEEKVDAEPEPTEEVPIEDPGKEEKSSVDKSQIIDEVRVALEAQIADALKKYEEGLERYAKVQKRSPAPATAQVRKSSSLIDQVGTLDWKAVHELAQRGA